MNRATGPYPFPTVALPARHFVALTAVVIVFLAHRAAGTIIDDGSLFLLLTIVVLGSAWFAGTGSALSVTVLGAVIGSLVKGTDRSRAIETHLALFVGQGLLLTALVAELRRARRAAEREAGLAHAARADAEAASRMKDEFLGTISHELRTPLNAVLGWLHLIRTGKLDQETTARGFESIERNVRLQAQVTGDLLDMSKALTGRLLLDVHAVSLRTVLSEAVSQASGAASARDVTLNVAAGRDAVVRGDPNRLRQLVWHLLANAIKFTPRGGSVDVALEVNDQARITVRDSGPGIDPAFLPVIFGRFTQADSSPTRASGGLGVGLSLAREIVERHGGDITVSNADKGGAMFTIHLPLHHGDQDEPTIAPTPTLATVSSPPLNGVRVLLLEHDRDVRELLSVALQHRGASVCVVSSVDEALEILESWRPDVLVSDAASPEHDAYVLVGKVHSLEAERGGRIPALALTTMARVDEGMRRMLADVKRDLPKPVEPAILTAEIARLTARERRHAQR
jgi:signal transduction histidine kinase/CheY-like chemotaxis protein